MKLFGWLREQVGGGTSQTSHLTASELQRRATAEAKAGRMDAAVESERAAQAQLVNDGVSMRGEEGIRVAMLLHKAGRHDEAWTEFNRLIAASGRADKTGVANFVQSAIYDKMRLCLQREKRFSEAVGMAVLAYCCHVKGFYVQSRMESFKAVRTESDVANVLSEAFFTHWVTPHLRKARAVEKLPTIWKATSKCVAALPALRLADLRQDVAKILSTQP